MHRILQSIVVVIGAFLVAVLIFDAIEGSNPASYIKAATAVFVTVLLFRSIQKNSKQRQVEIASNKRSIKMAVGGLAIGLGLPVMFIWLVKAMVR